MLMNVAVLIRYRTTEIKTEIKKRQLSFAPCGGGSGYHFERGQYQDDIADLTAVLPPVLRPLQAGDAHVAPLEMLDVAAGAERDKEGHL